MHYFTQNMPTTPLQQETPILGCLLMEIHGFCPPNRTYPPWPHLRYPLTSKDEDPNKKILARQSCSRVQRTILFYLAHSGYHALLHIKQPQTLRQKAPLTGCLLGEIRGFGRTTRPTPHSRTSATPSPQRMKILTKDLLGRVAHECRGQYCFISPTQHTMHYLTQNMPQTHRH